MKEVHILIENDDYVDSLIVSLVRQGYEVYLSWDKTEICFTIDDEKIGKDE